MMKIILTFRTSQVRGRRENICQGHFNHLRCLRLRSYAKGRKYVKQHTKGNCHMPIPPSYPSKGSKMISRFSCNKLLWSCKNLTGKGKWVSYSWETCSCIGVSFCFDSVELGPVVQRIKKKKIPSWKCNLFCIVKVWEGNCLARFFSSFSSQTLDWFVAAADKLQG